MKNIIISLFVIMFFGFGIVCFADEPKVYDMYWRDISEGKRLKDSAIATSGSENVFKDALGEGGSGVTFGSYSTFPTGSWPKVVVIADMNSDGYNDVAVATSYYFDPENDNHLHVFTQNAARELEFYKKYQTGSRPECIDSGDLNGDGTTDVIVGNFGDNTLGLFIQNSAREFNPMVSYAALSGPDGVKVSDLNNDGLADVAVSHWQDDYIGILNQNTSGALDPMVKYYVKSAGYDEIDVGDLNNDYLDDVVYMRGQGLEKAIVIFYQNSSGTLQDPVFYDFDMRFKGCIAIGDLNGDGKNDLVMAGGGNRPDSKLIVWLQNEKGELDSPQVYNAYDCPEAVEISDINGDNRADVIIAHGGWCEVSVYTQNASGTLDAYVLFPIPYASHYQPQGLAVEDFNSDGKPDMAIADYNHGLVVLYNETNYPPVLNPIGDRTIDEGQLLEFTLSVSDPEESTLNYSITNSPEGATFDSVTGTFRWTPTYKQAGTYPNVHFEVSDDGNLSDSEDITITVNNVNLPPQTGTISPSSGDLVCNQEIIFTTTYSDLNGWEDITLASLLFNNSITKRESVYGYYDNLTNKLYFHDYSQRKWLGGFAPGSANIIETPWAKLNCQNTTVSGDNITLIINWAITFKPLNYPNYPIPCKSLLYWYKNAYLYVIDRQKATDGWDIAGTFRFLNNIPTVDTLTPSSGSSKRGQAVKFTATYSDLDGWQNIRDTFFLVNTQINGANCFYAYYHQDTNKLYLRDDADTEWLGGFTPGSTNTIENSYAKLDCANTKVSRSENTIIIKWNIVFKSAFRGDKKMFLRVVDDGRATSGWKSKGTWTVK